MTESKIPSSRPTAPASGVKSGGGKTTNGTQDAVNPITARTPVQDALVKQSPARFLLSAQTSTLEGSVLSSTPAQGQIKVSTPRGDFVIQSDKNIPAGTPVTLHLITRHNQLLASLTIFQRQNAAEKKAEQTATPSKNTPPALKAGDTVAAVRLSAQISDDETIAAATPRRVSLQEIAQSLQSLTPAQLRQLPRPLPLPPDVLYRLAQAQNMQQALEQLTPAQQQAVLDYAARADVQAALNKFSPQTILQNALNATGDTADADIVRIIRTLQPPPAASITGKTPTALASLLPLLQTLEQPSTRFSPPVFQTESAGLLPKNLHNLTILGIAAPDNTGTAPLPALPPALTASTTSEIILGVVEAITPSGYPLIHTEAGQDFVLKTLADVPVGSKIFFTVGALSLQDTLNNFGAVGATAQGAFNPLRSTQWPALQEALQTLTALAPDAAQQMASSLPTTAAARFAPTTLLFLAALRMDSLQSWLGGTALQKLKQNGGQSLIDRLTGDFSKISAQSRAALPGGWRGISLPLMHQGEISQAQFFWRRQEDEGQEKSRGQKPMTRFILNLHLSRMGDMQLDGLMRQKKLDMILRAAHMLPLTIRQELMQAYAAAMTQTQMQGTLGFQIRADKWEEIDLPHQSGLSA